MTRKITVKLLLVALLPACLNACVAVTQKKASPAPVVATSVKPYPLDTCMVIGAKLNSTPKTYTRVYKGQEVKFCCTSCITAFEANPEYFLTKLKKGKNVR